MSATVRWRVPAIARRAVTMVPAVVVLAAGVNQVAALVRSQIALSLALPAMASLLIPTHCLGMAKRGFPVVARG